MMSQPVPLTTMDWNRCPPSIGTSVHHRLEQVSIFIGIRNTSALLLRRGIIAPLPDTGGKKEDRFPIGIGFQYLNKVIETLRDGAVHGLYHSLWAERHDSSWRPMRKLFEAVSRIFEDRMHDYGISMLVRAAHEDKDIDEAKAIIRRAIRRIESDPGTSAKDREKRLQKIHSLLDDFG
jgi:hypothetical protein